MDFAFDGAVNFSLTMLSETAPEPTFAVPSSRIMDRFISSFHDIGWPKSSAISSLATVVNQARLRLGAVTVEQQVHKDIAKLGSLSRP